MKKAITFTLLGLGIAVAAITGCSKPGGSGSITSGLPNLINFEIATVSSFVPGFGAAVALDAPNLGSGTFTVNYNLTSSTTSSDNVSNATATLTMNGTTGTFNTASIADGGNVSITINSISNSSGSSTLTSNNTQTFSDSTGLMTGTYTPKGGAAQSFRATDVSALLTGPLLQITGNIWTPNVTLISLKDFSYTGVGSTSFNINDPGSLPGSASYQIASLSINDYAIHGTITVTTVSPLLTGTFNYTDQDSSVVAGSFSCAYP